MLNLYDTSIGDKGAEILFKTTGLFPDLESIELGQNSIADKSFKVIVKSHSFPNLRSLKLSSNMITD